MSPTKKFLIFQTLFCLLISTVAQQWLGPFIKRDEVNPILLPKNNTEFFCPVLEQLVNWESKDVFNPTALVWKKQIHLLYRAEDSIGEFAGTSRIGHAISSDGLTFERYPTPIFYPDKDTAFIYEWPGGSEDPRIVQGDDGTFVMTYTAYDGTLARLLVASSRDLQIWTKHGSVFKEAFNGSYVDMWSKSGSIVTELVGESEDEMTAQAIKINGFYWMYWGDTNIFLATSTDLINWTPYLNEEGTDILKIFGPREGKFDSGLVEPGPQALRTPEGIYLIYNSRNKAADDGGDPSLPEGTYSAGQILFDPEAPHIVKGRTDEYFMTPDKDYEIIGQVNNVVFIEGLVFYKGQYFVYYGTADSKIALASTTAK